MGIGGSMLYHDVEKGAVAAGESMAASMVRRGMIRDGRVQRSVCAIAARLNTVVY